MVEKSCLDPTGAEFYKIIKQIEPQLNKNARPQNTADAEQKDDETEKIAENFRKISDKVMSRPQRARRNSSNKK